MIQAIIALLDDSRLKSNILACDISAADWKWIREREGEEGGESGEEEGGRLHFVGCAG